MRTRTCVFLLSNFDNKPVGLQISIDIRIFDGTLQHYTFINVSIISNATLLEIRLIMLVNFKKLTPCFVVAAYTKCIMNVYSLRISFRLLNMPPEGQSTKANGCLIMTGSKEHILWYFFNTILKFSAL